MRDQENERCVVCNQTWSTHDDGEHEATMRGGQLDPCFNRLRTETSRFHAERAQSEIEQRRLSGSQTPEEIEIEQFLAEMRDQTRPKEAPKDGLIVLLTEACIMGTVVIAGSIIACVAWVAVKWVLAWDIWK